MVAALQEANARLREQNAELQAENAELKVQLAEQAEKIARLERQALRNSLLTEQRSVFPQLEGCGGSWLYGHGSWPKSRIGILRYWWCPGWAGWWRPGTGMSRSG